MAETIVYDGPGAPRITLTRTDRGALEAVIEVEGLAPQRDITAEERFAGILSLDPPTVRVRPARNVRKMHRSLISAACRAVSSSATSTTGETGGPGAIICVYMRVALAMRQALRRLGEDI
nr:MAG: hypothetical protein DIU58_12380 [Sphaerobacter thermophilus]